MTDIVLTGFRRVDDRLKALPEKLLKQALRSATRDIAKLTLRMARDEAPHDTGELERSLTVKALKRSRRWKWFVGSSVQTREGMFTGDQFYGGFLEYGTNRRRTKSGANRGIGPERAYLRPALYRFPDRKRRLFQVALVRWLRKQITGKGTKR